MVILVTCGANNTGSHTSTVELLNAGFEVIIVDNFLNNSPEVLNSVREIIFFL